MASRADQLASSINFSKFGKATELKNRIWFTIGALIVFRFLSFVPLPGVDPVALSRLYSQAASGGILDIFNTFSGGSLEPVSYTHLDVYKRQESLGVADVVTKSVGTSNPYNMIRATFQALGEQTSPKSVAQRRGKKVSDLIKRGGVSDRAAEAEAAAVTE